MSNPTTNRAARRPRKAVAAPTPTPTPDKLAEGGEAIAATEPADNMLPGAFNLDELQREGRAEPFAFIHNNRQYILADPAEQDWQQLLIVMSNPVLFLRLVLADDADRDAFFDNPMPTWKLTALTKAYRAHYGLPDSGEANGLSV